MASLYSADSEESSQDLNFGVLEGLELQEEVDSEESSQDVNIWGFGGLELQKDVQDAVDNHADRLLEALRLKDGKYFEQNPGTSHLFLCRLLQLYGPNSGRPSLAAYSGMNDVLCLLRGQLGRHLNLDEQYQQQSLLHLAIEEERPESVQLLLAHGANPDLKSKSNDQMRTPWEFLVAGWKPSESYMLREMRAIFELHCLAIERPEDYITFAWHDSKINKTRGTTAEANLMEIGNFGPFAVELQFSIAWVHVLKNSFPTILPIVRAVQRSLSLRITWDALVKCFLDSITSPAMAPREPLLNYRDPTYTPRFINVPEESSFIVFPCLALQTMQEWGDRKKINEEDRDRMFPKGLTVKPDWTKIYFERTLDEAYYPGLDSSLLEARNHDQVIQKQIKKENTGTPSRTVVLPILMVPQLWLWKVNNVLISSYPMTHPSTVFEKPGNEQASRLLPELCNSTSVDLQIAHILKAFIDSFGQAYRDSTTEISFPSTLDIFENAVVTLLSDVRTYIISRESHDIEIGTERKFIESISDIQNELDMIGTIIEQQKGVLDDFKSDISTKADREQKRRKLEIEKLELEQRKPIEQSSTYRESRDVRIRILKLEGEETVEKEIAQILTQAKHRLDKYTKRIEKINRDVGRVAKTMDDMLNLSRTDASIKEARASVLVGMAALAFAVVTIIFTPLSFVTGLLALPIDQPNSDERVLGNKYVGWKLAVAEVVTVVVTGLIVLFTYLWYSGFASHFRRKPGKKSDDKEEKQSNVGNQRKERRGEQARRPGQLSNERNQQSEKDTIKEEGGQQRGIKSKEKADPQPRGDDNV